MKPCAVILKTENVTHRDIELIIIIVIELNRETKIHTPTFKGTIECIDTIF